MFPATRTVKLDSLYEMVSMRVTEMRMSRYFNVRGSHRSCDYSWGNTSFNCIVVNVSYLIEVASWFKEKLNFMRRF